MSPIGSIAAVYQILGRIIPARTPNDFATLATAAADGTAYARAVLLRGFEAELHQLWINTNLHTQKVVHLRHHPEAEVSLWLPRQKIQLRLLATWRVVDAAQARTPALEGLRQRAWDAQPPYARRLYATQGKEDTPPADFAVLVGTLYRIDALRITRNTYEQYVHDRARSVWQSRRVTA